jgi:large subunit ribosomal protein L16
MFNPVKLKFKKEHKKTFKNKEYSLKNTKLLYGRFGISSKVKGFLCYKEIFAAKKLILKAIKGIGILVTRVYPIRPRTKKKSGMRMGKGKGNVSSWVVLVKAGMVLFEVIGLVEKKIIKLAFKNASLRLNLATKNINRRTY